MIEQLVILQRKRKLAAFVMANYADALVIVKRRQAFGNRARRDGLNRRIEPQLARVEILLGRAPQQLLYAVVCLRSGGAILRVERDQCLIRLDAAIVLERTYYMRVGHDGQLIAECRMQVTATHQKTSTDTSAAVAADQRHRTRPFHSAM
ncbi:MAG TPA: hypothetical protein VHT52_19000 [Stellaceae bacterium]|nr:hypothetical protein [Stellaceae bacterium]